MSTVMFTAKHDDNAPVTRVHVEYEDAKKMQVFYRRMGFLTGIGCEPQPAPVRIASGVRKARQQGKVKLTVKNLQELLASVSMSPEDKLMLVQQMLHGA